VTEAFRQNVSQSITNSIVSLKWLFQKQEEIAWVQVNIRKPENAELSIILIGFIKKKRAFKCRKKP
jgi:hypothetical protein